MKNNAIDKLAGAAVQRARSELGLTQADLAAHMKWHQQTVHKVEKGTRPLRLSEAVRLVEILGMDLDAFGRSVVVQP